MDQVLAQKPWRSFLPEAYHWTAKLKPEAVKAPQAGATHLVAVSTNDAKKTIDIKCASLDQSTKDKLQKAIAAHGWQGKSGTLSVVVDDKAFVLLPLPKIRTTAPQIARQFGLDAARAIKDNRLTQVVIGDAEGLDSLQILDGFANGLYSAGLFKNIKKKAAPAEQELPEKVAFFGTLPSANAIDRQKALIKSSLVTRMLQDAPANWLDPVRFGEIAKDLAKEAGITCTVKGKRELTELGMGSFLSVAAGSPIEPQMIVLEIPGQDNGRTRVLIGKGLTFDTGGNSIKPSLGMGEMKYDMSGGAAVLGTALYLAHVKPPTKVICIIGAVENMPGGTATRPGDIVVAMNGKSIDVANTDAEGRLVLCDLLYYAASTIKPELMIDIATLTGAVLHALGNAGAAVMSNDQATADLVLNAGRDVGEPFWQLPLWPELEKEVKSEVADLQNIAKPNVNAGSVIGGVFLREFVGDTKWAHLDIAGTGWSCKATGFPSPGGSAYGVRTMSQICLQE